MSILKFDTDNNTNTRRATPAADRPAAKQWLNVGYEVPFTNDKGEEEVRFVNLPVGIPLDTMEPLAIRGQSESFAQLRSAQNDLLKALQNAGDELEPGGEVTIRLIVKLRKVNDAITVDKESNPLSFDISSLIG